MRTIVATGCLLIVSNVFTFAWYACANVSALPFRITFKIVRLFPRSAIG
jgi:uncharacterized protein (DUF486 family)